MCFFYRSLLDCAVSPAHNSHAVLSYWLPGESFKSNLSSEDVTQFGITGHIIYSSPANIKTLRH